MLSTAAVAQNTPANEATHQGVVRIWDHALGSGYIREAVSDQDIFVHSLDLVDEVERGDRVTFSITPSVKWPRAENVRRILPVERRQ